MPNVRVFAHVPKMKTMVRDLKRAGVTMANEQRQRLDFPA
jgi:hypothetical protein